MRSATDFFRFENLVKPSNPAAFLFASGGMADQTARLLGIITIDLELKQIGINRLERFIFMIWLAIAAGVSNAILKG